MGGQNQTSCFHEPRVPESLSGRLCRREKGSDRQVRGSPGGQRRNMIAVFLVLLKNIFSPFKSDPKHFFLLESCFASPRQPGYESSFSDVCLWCQAVLEA